MLDNREKMWLHDALEELGCCPICQESKRVLLHDELTDDMISATDRWKLYMCANCSSVYLDPRPKLQNIGNAYLNYFTHQPTVDFAPKGVFASIKKNLCESYSLFKYSGQKEHHLKSQLFQILFPLRRYEYDAMKARHLPCTPGLKLLDIGCGNGAFLHFARERGWIVEGIDFDSKAVETARSLGIQVEQGGVEKYGALSEQFDYITLSHVIEHVHDPAALLAACKRLLKPGGALWLETPNISSLGHKIFGAAWRGLEPPRHLYLFSEKSISSCLKNAGFSKIEIKYHGHATSHTLEQSRKILRGLKANKTILAAMYKRFFRIFIELLESQFTSCREFITVVAKK
jgi:2-polyprenyl-3-methyl-5-hydroxy-6-metoxy-1,4-benzoquinol methylase